MVEETGAIVGTRIEETGLDGILIGGRGQRFVETRHREDIG